MQDKANNMSRVVAASHLAALEQIDSSALNRSGNYLVYGSTRTDLDANLYVGTVQLFDVATHELLKSWQGYAPQWSPTADEIAYLKDDDSTGLWLYSVHTDSHQHLATLHESHYFMGHQVLKNFAWSPDGEKIAYLCAAAPVVAEATTVYVIERLLYKTKGGRGRPFLSDDNQTHIFLVSKDGAILKQLTSGEYNEHSITWSPGGNHLAFISNRTDDPDSTQAFDLWCIDLSTGIEKRLTNQIGIVSAPSWSPDGRHIAFLHTPTLPGTNDSVADDAKLYCFNILSGETKCLTAAFDRRVDQPKWNAGDGRLYFTAGDSGAINLYSMHPGDAELQLVLSDQNMIHEYHIANGYLLFTTSDIANPADLFIRNLQNGEQTCFTHNRERLSLSASCSPGESFWYKAADGTAIQAWVVPPSLLNLNKQYPLLLVIHGGPHNMVGYAFEERTQLLSANGYGVLHINPRGSSGYGQEFSNGTLKDWGGKDYHDLMAGVDAAIEKFKWIDVERLGVTGQSYGGYMTNWIITQTNRFKAAVSDGGISNLASFYGTSLYHSLIETEFGEAEENFPLLWERSPLRHAKNVQTPTLFLHGETDNEVPATQAEEMFIALKKRKLPTVLLLYKNEGHGWRPDLLPQNKYDVIERIIGWMNLYLKPGNK